MHRRKKGQSKFLGVIGGILTAAAVVNLFFNADSIFKAGGSAIAAAIISDNDEVVKVEKTGENMAENPLAEDDTDENTENTEAAAESNGEEETIDPAEEFAGEAVYPVIETNIGASGTLYENISVKNTTGYDIDIGSLLERDLGFTMDDSGEVQVLIVHTHATEGYMSYDNGTYHESYSSRNTDNSQNVCAVGDEIAAELSRQGIGVINDTTQHDNPSYNGSYDRSLETINSYLEKYPNIKVILDIHRDSIGYGGEQGKTKPTFTFDGKKAAQIMIMSGYDGTGEYNFPFWEENLVFALKLQKTAEDMFPGMTRPLYFGNFAYNMNVNNGSLLIEVGTDMNTLEEAKYTGELLGKVLAKVLQS